MSTSFQQSELGSLTRSAPVKLFGCQAPNTAPVGSAKNAIRPMSITSIGSSTTVPPAALTLAAVSSALATLTYVAHAMG